MKVLAKDNAEAMPLRKQIQIITNQKELMESKVLWNRFRDDSNSLGENQGSAITPSANNPSRKDSVLNPHSIANVVFLIYMTNKRMPFLSFSNRLLTRRVQ